MIYKYDEKDKRIINSEFNVVDVYSGKSEELDYVVVNLDGEHGSCINTKSTKIWIILEGRAKVYINGEMNEVSQGDLVIINRNEKHNIIGKVKFAVISTPPYDASTEIFE